MNKNLTAGLIVVIALLGGFYGGFRYESSKVGTTAAATGTTGFAQGGGIWNGSQFNPPPILLTIENTNVTHNALNASAGLAVEGGGVFTTFPVTLKNSLIAKNQPDQCFGC